MAGLRRLLQRWLQDLSTVCLRTLLGLVSGEHCLILLLLVNPALLMSMVMSECLQVTSSLHIPLMTCKIVD